MNLRLPSHVLAVKSRVLDRKNRVLAVKFQPFRVCLGVNFRPWRVLERKQPMGLG